MTGCALSFLDGRVNVPFLSEFVVTRCAERRRFLCQLEGLLPFLRVGSGRRFVAGVATLGGGMDGLAREELRVATTREAAFPGEGRGG